MGFKNNLKKSERDIYKILFFILLLIVIIVFLYFSFRFYSEKKFNEGSRATLFLLKNTLDENGYVSIIIDNESITLVPESRINQTIEELVNYIINTVQKDGFISVSNNKTEITLVPYKPVTSNTK